MALLFICITDKWHCNILWSHNLSSIFTTFKPPFLLEVYVESLKYHIFSLNQYLVSSSVDLFEAIIVDRCIWQNGNRVDSDGMDCTKIVVWPVSCSRCHQNVGLYQLMKTIKYPAWRESLCQWCNIHITQCKVTESIYVPEVAVGKTSSLRDCSP